MRRILGVISLLIGLSTVLWVAYNVLIKTTPEALGRDVLGPLAVSGLLILVGLRWIQGKQAG